MSEFILSGFADEIDANFDQQLEGLTELGIRFIEIRGVDGENIADLSLEKAAIIKDKLSAHDIKVSAIGSPIGKISILDDFADECRRFRHILELAKLLEAPYIRMFSFFIPDGQNPDIYSQEVLARWRMYVQLAEGYDGILLHENEKGIYGDTAERCAVLLSAMNSDKVKATFDPANFVQCNVDPLTAYDILKPYIAYIHIKDAKKNGEVVPSGCGDGHVKELFALLKQENYSGFASLEPHLGDFQGFAALEGNSAEKAKTMQKSGKETFRIARDAFLSLINYK